MTRRRYLTAKAKSEIYHDQNGCCAECGDWIMLAETQWDHILPLCLGGSNENNWQGLCMKCHAKKTRAEARMRAKADRQRKYHEGTKKRRGRKLQGRGFDTRLRRRVDGRVEVVTLSRRNPCLNRVIQHKPLNTFEHFTSTEWRPRLIDQPFTARCCRFPYRCRRNCAVPRLNRLKTTSILRTSSNPRLPITAIFISWTSAQSQQAKRIIVSSESISNPS